MVHRRGGNFFPGQGKRGGGGGGERSTAKKECTCPRWVGQVIRSAQGRTCELPRKQQKKECERRIKKERPTRKRGQVSSRGGHYQKSRVETLPRQPLTERCSKTSGGGLRKTKRKPPAPMKRGEGLSLGIVGESLGGGGPA